MRLSRGSALLGATIFQLGAFFASQTQHLGAVSGAAWLPLAWLSVLKLGDRFEWRTLGWLALALSLSFLAGFPAIAAAVFGSTILLTATLILFRKAPLKLSISVMMGCIWAGLLSAVVLIPMQQLVNLSVASLRGGWTNSWGINLKALVSLVVPNYYHVFDPEKYSLRLNQSFLYLYCGLAGLVLSILGALWSRHKERLVFLVVTMVSALWMLGYSTPVGATLLPLLPKFMKAGLYVEFAMAPFVLGLAVLAAFGAEQFIALRGRFLTAAVVILTAFDLIAVSSGRFLNTAKGSVATYEHYYSSSDTPVKMRTLVQETTPPSRTDLITDGQAWAATAPYNEVPSASGNDPLALIRFLKLRLCFADGNDWERFYRVSSPDSPLVDLMNIRFLVVPPERLISSSRLVRREELKIGHIYENTDVLPRFFLVSDVRNSKSLEDTLSIMCSPGFDPGQTAVVEGHSSFVPTGTKSLLAPVRVICYNRNSLELEVSNGSPAFLVTSEAHYPGWRCSVDGKDQPLLVTNAAFRGLPVPAGRHRIAMEYAPRAFWYGSAISLLACGLLIAAIRKRPAPPV
jgi:hypothetical protein